MGVLMIRANRFVGIGFHPGVEGSLLARSIMDDLRASHGLRIDVSDIKPELLISSFFIGFMRECHIHGLLDKAINVDWIVKHPFQRENISKWIGRFASDNIAAR